MATVLPSTPLSTVTGESIVKDAMLNAGILGVGQTMSNEDLSLGLRILNRLIQSWGNENLMIYATSTADFTMVPNQAEYSTTLFTDGRPMSIHSMYVSLNNIDYEVEMIDQQTYDAIPYKPAPAIPNKCFYNNSFPNGSLFFYPTPYAAFTCHVITRMPLVSGTIAASTTISLPLGYEKALVDCLEVELYRPFQKPVRPDSVAAAKESKAVLKRLNYEPVVMQSVMDKVYDVSNGFIYKGF